MNELFGNMIPTEVPVIRTLGFYQPFCSLMFHGKIETRIVMLGRKPPFPLGKYLFYSTKEPSTDEQLTRWCSFETLLSMGDALSEDETFMLNGYALGTGELVNIRLMTEADEDKCFVAYKGVMDFTDKEGRGYQAVQWCLEFKNVKRIEPFEFKGKQGVGFLPHSVEIKYL